MHLSTLARRLGSVALVAAVALGSAACSEDSSSGTDSSGSEESSSESGSESGSESTEEGADAGSEESAPEESAEEAPAELSAADFYPSVMGALQDAETFAFESTTTAGAQSSTVSGQARYADSGMQMKASSTGAQAMDLIMLDEVIYMKAPQMGMGDKWVKIDLRAGGNPLFTMLAKATDPEAMFKAMEKPEKLELVGAEEVDGVPTNHYRITMDPDAYMKAMGFPAEMASFLPEEMVSDMWVDGDNLPRKFSQTVEVPAPGGGRPTTTTTEGVYDDFGVEVDITAPPASETTEAPGLPGA